MFLQPGYKTDFHLIYNAKYSNLCLFTRETFIVETTGIVCVCVCVSCVAVVAIDVTVMIN